MIQILMNLKNLLVRADTAEVSSPDIDDNEESSILIKLEPKKKNKAFKF